MKWVICFLFGVFALMPTLAIGQKAAGLDEFQKHFDQAAHYSSISMYGESIEELNLAIGIAEEFQLEEQRIEGKIALAELMRKTTDWDKGLNILYNLQESERYPLLHVRKLGRMAAIHHEEKTDDKPKQLDTVRIYLEQAIELAEEHNFKLEEAALKNELGYLISRNKDIDLGQKYLLEAATIFMQYGDTQNYVVTSNHVLENHLTMRELKKADELSKHLLEVIEGKDWYTTAIDLYDLIGVKELLQGDSVGYLKAKVNSSINFTGYVQAINTGQMASFRVKHQTQEYQEQAEQSEKVARQREEELAEQTARTRELIIYLSVLGAFILGVVALLFRERRLKQAVDQANSKLQVANEKYHMLIVESNHRIKNNLQMIISMLEYASRELDDTNTQALKRMSSKIHTISALHKHLYLDVHNERVDLDTYFSEIVKLYEEIAPVDYSIDKHIDPVGIKSERIVYFGLIFNEMLSNTIEHGNSPEKRIQVRVSQLDGSFRFDYMDGSELNGEAPEGMGSLLIRQLIQRVGGENLETNPSTGHYQFTFHA